MKYQLYYFSACPYCIIVRITLWCLGLKIPLKNIFTEPDDNTELVLGGGKDQVPCLRIEDEGGRVRWMYESIDIIQYLYTERAKIK